MGDNLGNLSQDLDIFGAPEAPTDETEEISTELSVDDLFGPSEDIEPPVVPEGTEKIDETMPEGEDDKEKIDEEPPVDGDKPEAKEDDSEGTGDKDEDVKKFIEDLLADNVEIEDKVQELADKADGDGDNELQGMISDLQKLLTEKESKIEEQSRQLEVSNNRFLEKVGEAENFSIYKDVIDKLEGDSKLMMLVKHKDTDNEKVKERLTGIVTDILFDMTGQDVSQLLDDKVKDDVSTALGTPESNSPTTPSIKPEEEDKDIDFEESINMLF